MQQFNHLIKIAVYRYFSIIQILSELVGIPLNIRILLYEFDY